MKFSIFKMLTIALFIVSICGCESKNTEYYDCGGVKEISYSNFFTKTPSKKDEFSKEGKLISRLIFNNEGYLSSGLELSENGDSIVSTYSNKGKNSYSIIYTIRGDIYFYPYVNKKLTGVVRYYKKSKLLKRFLYVQDSVVSIEFFNKLSKGKSIIVNENRNNEVHEKAFVNEDFDLYVSQYLANVDRKMFPSGTYFRFENSDLIDTVHGDFVHLDLLDTLQIGETVKGKLLWNHWNKKELYLEYYMNKCDSYSENSLKEKSLKINSSYFDIDFDQKATSLGYHYIASHAILRNRDSSIYQDFIVYDDFYVIP